MDGAVAKFIAGLRELGYDPTVLPEAPNYVVFDYEVLCGPFTGEAIKLGFVVPPDFHITSPSGPHSTPVVVNDDGSGQAPRGGLHMNYDPQFKARAGGDWQYWSRPYPNWSAPTAPVRTYMAFIKRLWAAL